MAEIIWYGHSNCCIHDGITIWIDPFFEGNPSCIVDWRTLKKPDVVLVTHSHNDHTGQAAQIVKETKAMLGCIVELATHFREDLDVPAKQILNHGSGWNLGGTIKYKDTSFTMVQAFHSSEYGLATGFITTCSSDITYYHAGDTSIFTDMRLLGDMYKIDIAFLPIGDIFTMGAEQAGRAALLLGADAVIPIHYKTFPTLEQSADNFCIQLERFAPDCKAHILVPNQSLTLQIQGQN